MDGKAAQEFDDIVAGKPRTVLYVTTFPWRLEVTGNDSLARIAEEFDKFDHWIRETPRPRAYRLGTPTRGNFDRVFADEED